MIQIVFTPFNVVQEYEGNCTRDTLCRTEINQQMYANSLHLQAQKKGASLVVVGVIIAVYQLVCMLASPVIGYHVSSFTVV